MALTNPDAIVTERDLANFYQGIFPYLGAYSIPHKVYGIHISNTESVPSSKVTYIADAVGMTPAHMDYTNDVFDYGSWADAFFMPRPCMLKYDGTVDYYLDPNDYTKKEDGTASDVGNTSYAGNAMMEWGRNGKKIWLKIVPDTSQSGKGADIYIADYQADLAFTDWNFHNSAGESVDHFYTSIYNGSLIDSKTRSLSGQTVSSKKTFQNEMDYAAANNPSGSLIWTIDVISDVDLITILLMLIGKSTDCQAVFGQGLSTGGTEAILNSFTTGVHNNKGLFYGTNDGTTSTTTYSNAVKVFGMENWWGLINEAYLGEISIKGARKRKLTYNTEDGTTVVGYNVTGDGYLASGVASLSGSTYVYIKECVFNVQGMYPLSTSGGSESTYYCDGVGVNTSYTCIAGYAGNCSEGSKIGMFFRHFGFLPATTQWFRGSRLAAKPLSPAQS